MKIWLGPEFASQLLMRLAVLISSLTLLPALSLAAGPYGRYRPRQNPHLARYQAQQKGEMRRIRERMKEMAEWRGLKSNAAAKKVGYESLAALRGAIPKIEDSLVSSAQKLRLRGSEGAELFRDVVETIGARRSQSERKAFSAKLKEKGVQPTDEPYFPLKRLAELQRKVEDRHTLLTKRDRRALLHEIDGAALRVIVGSKRYREQLRVAQAKLEEGQSQLRQGAVYALHPLLEAKRGADALKRVEAFVPEKMGASLSSQSWGEKREKVFSFHLYPEAPKAVQALGKQLPLLQRQAAVRGLRYASGRLAQGKVEEGSKALKWLEPHLASMTDLQRVLGRVKGLAERRIERATAKGLKHLGERLAALTSRREREQTDPRQSKAVLMAELSQLYSESQAPELFGRGAGLAKRALAELVQAAGAQKRHLHQLSDTILRADHQGDGYASFVTASKMVREAQRASQTLELLLKLRTVSSEPYRDLLQIARAAAEMKKQRAQSLDAEAEQAFTSAWEAIRSGRAVAGAQQAKAWGDAFEKQPERPGQTHLVKKARQLQRRGERAPARRARAIRSELATLELAIAGENLSRAQSRAERLRRRVIGYADLKDRGALLRGVDAVLEGIRREALRRKRRQRLLPARKALAVLRQVRDLLGRDKVDEAIRKLDSSALRRVGTHRELIARRAHALRTGAVQRKAEGLIGRAELLLLQHQGGKARELALEVQRLAERHDVHLDATPPRRGKARANTPGRPSLVRRLQRILDATRPPRHSPMVAQAFRALGLAPQDPLQATYERAKRAFSLIMKETSFIRTGQTAGKSPEEIRRANDQAINAQKAWRVIRRQVKPR